MWTVSGCLHPRIAVFLFTQLEHNGSFKGHYATQPVLWGAPNHQTRNRVLLKSKIRFLIIISCNLQLCHLVNNKAFLRLLYKPCCISVIFWTSTRPKNAIPRWYTGRKWRIPMASNRKRSRGGLRLMIWNKVKVPLCHYSDAPEESNLWTAWQLFPLDDD